MTTFNLKELQGNRTICRQTNLRSVKS